MVKINFDDDIVSLLPKGAPPYKKDDAPDGHNNSTLYNQFKMFKHFFKGPKSNVNILWVTQISRYQHVWPICIGF